MQRLICLVTLLFATHAFAQSKKQPATDAKKGPSPEMQKMMDEMEKAATPGPEHKWLTEMAGSWSTSSKFWMEPGKPPRESQGSEEIKPILGGRFIEARFTGMMMGKPFEGFGVSGYDNTKKKFVMIWMD